MKYIKVEAIICSNCEIVSELFWDIQRWVNIWSPIETVKMLYDDGFHQEILMQVFRDNKIEMVRTIRVRDQNNNIEFFSPLPPPMMKFHNGTWKFKSINKGSCLVEAERNYEILPELNKTIYSDNLFNHNFQLRLQNILNKFVEYFNIESK